MKTKSKTNSILFLVSLLLLVFFGIISCKQHEKPIFKRFEKNPIISPASLPGTEGDDINGPSLIKAPDWLPNKLGKYYLYFAHHKGKYIRLAYTNDLKGKWEIYKPGTLKLSETLGNKSPFPAEESVKHEGAENKTDEVQHIASPDVHIDEVNKQIVLYFHTPLVVNDRKGQYTLRAVSKDGINFTADTIVLGESYFRVFQWKDNYYALGRSSSFWRSKDGRAAFEKGPNPFLKLQNPSTLRHSALQVVGDTLYVFYSRVGDAPEHILLSKIKLTDNWNQWEATQLIDIAVPETDYEGFDLPVTKSKSGLYYGKTRELRDPALYVEGEKWYLLYSVAGENGIGIGELNLNLPPTP
jgi:hypothetical protein